MHLVVVSHACVTDINQQVFAEMESLGHKIDLIVPRNFIAPGLTDEPIKVRRWPEFKGRIIEIPILFNKSIPLHFYKKNLSKMFYNSRPDAVYVAEEPYSLSCFQIVRSAIPFTKVIGFYSAQNINKKYPYIFTKMEQYVYKNSSVAICVSKDVTKVLREKGYKKDVQEIALGVDEGHFIYSQKYRNISRKELNIPTDAYVIGYAGRIVQEKGVDLLIEAFTDVALSDRNTYLIIIGRGPLLDNMKEMVDKSEISHLVKFVDYASHTDMPKWFNCMDVHVLPSKTMPNWREQFGRVLVEAGACGVPSIGSSSGEIPNVLKNMGMNSIFEEGKKKDLVKEIIKLKNEPVDPLLIRNVTIAQYGNKGIAVQIIDAFKNVI
ncbi:glycosyltransferase [Metabacillus litoralis]|uniref:glycosyltransferase n=1 Tax=Metabacillus litoralis TaxID=152268 RepID=UPI00203FC141|nr:glycosyltransferase [Metabacillus litoralis]MCM3161740.1 glycosyltransferase [Metabacillus litoralis]